MYIAMVLGRTFRTLDKTKDKRFVYDGLERFALEKDYLILEFK
jgi:hypothetical protein